MKQTILFLIVFILGSITPAFSQVQTEVLSDVNFSTFDGSSRSPKASYEDGVAKFMLVEMEGLEAGKVMTLFFDFVSKTGSTIYSGFLAEDSHYAFKADLDSKEYGFKAKNLTTFYEKYSNNTSRGLGIYLLCNEFDSSQEPYAIRILIYEDEEVVLSSVIGYSKSNWQKIQSILQRYKNTL